MGVQTKWKVRLFASAVLSLSIPVAGAHAQDAAGQAPASAVPPAAGAALEEVIVTAQKRSENAQSVPISISTVTASQLEKQKVSNVVDIAAQVPNLYITTPYSDAVPIFSLRGVSAVDYSQNQSSPVALYVDEVYKGLPVFTSLQVFDIERVEVLRGPQGTLYGKNTTGGAVNFYTRRANPNEGFTGYLTGGLGRFNRREAAGGVNIPMIDGVLAGRAAFTRTKARGFVENLTPGIRDQGAIDDWAMRLGLTFTPTDDLDMTLRYTRSSSTPEGGYAGLADNIGPEGVFFAGVFRDGLGFYETETDEENVYRVKNESVALNTTWDFSEWARLTSVTSYDKGSWFTHEDGDVTPLDLLTPDYFSRGTAFSQDLRISSTDNGPFKWLVGAYYYRDRSRADLTYRFLYEFAADADGDRVADCADDDMDGDPTTVDPGDQLTGCAVASSLKQVRESYALYTQASLDLTDRLTLTAGLRYTRDKNRLDSYRSDLLFLDPVSRQEVVAFPIFETPPPGVSPRTDENISGKLVLDYELARNALLYASLSRGYRGSSFNGAAQFAQESVNAVPPERLDAAEVGIKTQVFDNRVRFNAAAFYYDYSNQQFQSQVGLYIVLDSGDARLWGAEAEVTAVLAEGLDVRLGASYLDSEYTDAVVNGVRLDGNQLIAAPEWKLSAAVDWRLFETGAGSVSLHADTSYTSRIYFDAFNTDVASQSGYFLHNARLTFETADERIALSAWIKNAAGKKYTTYRTDFTQAFNYAYGQRGRPREWGVEATYRF